MKHKSSVTPSGRYSRFLFRLCLLAEPADVRRRFGEEMERLFTEDLAAARLRGRRARLGVLFSALHDIVSAGLRERVRNPEVALTTATPYRSEGLAMDHLRQDVRFAIRSLARIPGFSLVAVLTLALGIGATTAIFSVVNGVLLRSLPYADADRLVRIWQTQRAEPSGPVEGSNSPVNFQDWKAEASSFEAMALYARSRPTLTGLGEPEVLQGSRVSPDFFRVFGAQPVLGRSFTDEENLPQGPRSVVISHGFWQQRMGGRADALGSTLELSGTPHEIIGVAPAGFDFPKGARVWMAVRNDDEGCGRSCVYLNTVGKLRENRSLEQARQELGMIADRLSQEFPAALKNGTVAMASLQDTMVGDVRRALLVLLGAVGFVLLIACANVANLLIARGATRTDEMAVRVALGAGRRRVLAQLMTESVVLALAGGAVGVVLAAVGVRALRVIAPGQIPRLDEVGLDATAVLFALGLSLLTVLVFGFAPALQLARGSVAGALRQDAIRTAGARRGIGRASLLAAEVALSLVLLIGAGLLLRTFASMQRVDPGYTLDEISHFTLALPGARYPTPDHAVRFLETLEQRLEARPEITETSIIMGLPLSDFALWSSITRPDLPPPPPGEGRSTSVRAVDEDFFRMMGVALVTGRPFTRADRHGAQPVAIVNRRLARELFGNDDPIGKQVRLGLSVGHPEDEARTIVGVVEDLRTATLTGDVEPELYAPYAQWGSSFATALVRSRGTAAAALAAARLEVSTIDPRLPIRDPGTMRQLVGAHTARPRFYLSLLALFAGLAITLAAVGLYGVVAYLVAQRSREIGVRLALGARAGHVVRLVVRQGFVPALVGAFFGLLAALAGARIMASLLFGVAPTDRLTFAGTTAMLLAVAFLACLIPAARATRIPPANALRAER